MKNLIVALVLLLTSNIYSQELLMDTEDVHPADVIEPKYNQGGLDKFYEYINHEFDFSKVTKPGKLITSFTIDIEGEIKNIRILKFPNDEAAAEIIRVLNKAQKWQPAKRGGKPFSTEIKIPLDFKLKPKTVSDANYQVIESEEKSFDKEIKKDSDDVQNQTDKKPFFSGGIGKFYKFIADNFRAPLEEDIKGKIIVTFIVEKDGSITDIKVIKDIGHGTREEAIRVMKKCPKWQPATNNGVPVRAMYTLPITI